MNQRQSRRTFLRSASVAVLSSVTAPALIEELRLQTMNVLALTSVLALPVLASAEEVLRSIATQQRTQSNQFVLLTSGCLVLKVLQEKWLRRSIPRLSTRS